MLKHLILLIIFFENTYQKQNFNDLLTDDNELAYIEPVKSNIQKRSLIKILHPCANHLCRPDQICIQSKTSQNNYVCSDRTASPKTLKNGAQAPKEKSHDKQIASLIKCDLEEVKLNMFDYFESRIQTNTDKTSKLTISVNSKFCPESVHAMFTKLDGNKDNKLTVKEWSQIDYFKETCTLMYFQKCDKDKNKHLTSDEFCNCFKNVHRKCLYIRKPTNHNSKKFYINNVQKILNINNAIRIMDAEKPQVKLDSENYTPQCDNEGRFLPMQCDDDVTCWCVDNYGYPRSNTLSFIDNKLSIVC